GSDSLSITTLDEGNTGSGGVKGDADSIAITVLSADSTPPSVTITLDDTVLNGSETTTVHFAFSEPVTGFTLDDTTASGGTLSGFRVIDASNYAATFTPAAGTETTTAYVAVTAGTYADLAGNPGEAGSSDDFTVDTVAAAPSAPDLTDASDSGT